MRNNRSRATLATLVVAFGAVVAYLHASRAWGQTPPDAVVFQPAPAIDGVIKAGTRPEVVVRGLRSSDDPIWVPNIGLVFSESQANRVVRLDANDQVTTFVGDLHGPLGMTLDRKGRLISLQSQAGFAGPRVIWPRGSEMVLADRFEGRPFARPNDVVSDSKGGVYFSDLPLRPVPPDAMAPAVYYVPPGASPIRVIDDIARPNGVQLSRDEKVLYVNDTGGVQAFAFDVLPDGRLTNRRVFVTYVGRDRSIPATDAPVSNADGLVIDAEGRVYALTEAGIEVIKADGQHLGIIPVWCITRRRQNLTFGGPDKRTLYVAGGGALLRTPMLSRGFGGRAK
jgi:sugar lactone lactonase YvrE